MSLTGKAKQNMLLKGSINRLKVIHTDAYELAVKNGFEGTLDEWLESLGATDEQLRASVEEYLVEHQPSLTGAEKKCLLTLFKNIVYTGDISEAYAELEEIWSRVPATKITLSSNTLVLNGEPAQLTAILTPADTTDKVVWTSSDPTVASADDGLVLPLAIGSCTITATAGPVSATCEVTVKEAMLTHYPVVNNLVNASTSNTSGAVEVLGSYTATITPDAGYSLTNAEVSVTMGGEDITSTAYSNGVINIASVTGNVVITVAAREIPSFTITNNLTNVTNSNSATKVTEGDFYSANLSWDAAYSLNSITITMGGVDVTADVYGEGKILITEVTGDVVITAEAGLPAPAYLLKNKTFDGSAGQIIDTGIALFDTDKDWSIFISLTTEHYDSNYAPIAMWHKSAESGYPNAIALQRNRWAQNWRVLAVTNAIDVADVLSPVFLVVTHARGQFGHTYYGIVGGEMVSGSLATRGVGTDGTLKIGGIYNYEETTESDWFIGTINTAEVHLRVLTEAEIKEKLGVA